MFKYQCYILKRGGLLKPFTEVGWFIIYENFHSGCFSLNKTTGGKSKGDVINDHENIVAKKKKEEDTKWQKKIDTPSLRVTE